MRRRPTKAELQDLIDRRSALLAAMGALRRLLAEEPADDLARLRRAAVEHPEATRRAILDALPEIDATLPAPWDERTASAAAQEGF